MGAVEATIVGEDIENNIFLNNMINSFRSRKNKTSELFKSTGGFDALGVKKDGKFIFDIYSSIKEKRRLSCKSLP